MNKFVISGVFSPNHKVAGGVRTHICFIANQFQSVSTKPRAYQCFILEKQFFSFRIQLALIFNEVMFSIEGNEQVCNLR